MDTKTTRTMTLCTALALATLTLTAAARAADLPAGIADAKPAEGQAVEITDGPLKGKFMVAYTQEVTTFLGTKIAIEFVPIPGGEYLMGSPESEAEREKHEGPQVKVKVDPFWMGKYEVTWDQFDPWLAMYRPIKDGAIKQTITDANRADAVSVPTPIWDQDALPIINAMGRSGGFPASHMSQLNARQFTKYLTKTSGRFYRLPTEAEWEYAARAGTTTAYFFGDDPEALKDYAWYFETSEWEDPNKGHPDVGAGYRKVGQLKPNPWGLYDMYGNVAEWCIDQRDADSYAKAKAKGEPVSVLDTVTWPSKYYGRVMRGGHWDSDAKMCRSAARLADEKDWKEHDPQLPQSVWFYTEFWLGFRPIRPLVEPADDVKLKFWEPDIEQWTDVLKEGKQAKYLVEDGAKGGK